MRHDKGGSRQVRPEPPLSYVSDADKAEVILLLSSDSISDMESSKQRREIERGNRARKAKATHEIGI